MASGYCSPMKSCFCHSLIFLGFAAQQSSKCATLNGPLKTTFFGRRWTLIWPLSPFETPLLSPLYLLQLRLILQ